MTRAVRGCKGARALGASVLRAFVLGTFVLGAFVLGAIGALSVTLSAQELPPGPGREIVAQRCVACHEADLIVAQRLTRDAWSRSIDKMVRWGATVAPDERDPMLHYLAAHFAPRPAASHIVATAQHEGTYKRACLTCHDADLVESQLLTRAGWVRTVDKMIRWGAQVSAADKDGLVDYLAARFPPR